MSVDFAAEHPTTPYNVAMYPFLDLSLRAHIPCTHVCWHLVPICPTHLLGHHGVGAPPRAHHALSSLSPFTFETAWASGEGQSYL